MTLRDFIEKKRHELRRRGAWFALRTGVQEAAIKTAGTALDSQGTPIWDADADVVLVLDACRADLWAEVARERYPAAAHETKWSVGSASVEWINNTFAPEHEHAWRSAGYVTANAFSGKQPGGHRDAAVYPLRDRGLAYLDEVWVEEWDTGGLESVLPATVTDRALWAWDRREGLGIDTLVVHYMQPHAPFRSHPEWTDGWEDRYAFGTETDPEKRNEWVKLRDGDIDREEMWGAYADNLRFVLTEVDRWRDATDADLLVTSDHGNGMGEWGTWGHPVGVATPAVRRVPWVRMRGRGERAPQFDLATEPPTHAGADAGVNDRLEALGYQ